MRATLTIPFLLLAACEIHLNHIDRTDSFSVTEAVQRVEVDSSAGDVFATLGEAGAVQVTRRISAVHEPELSSEVHGGVLRITADCTGLLGGCSVDHELTLPPGVALVITTGAGDVSLSGINTGIDVDTGAGDISGTGIGSSYVVANTGAGDLSFDLSGEPADIVLETGAGDVDLRLPSGVYECDLHSGAGDVSLSGITCEDSAYAGLYVHAGAGDLSILGR